jgi:hypothetical protein
MKPFKLKRILRHPFKTYRQWRHGRQLLSMTDEERRAYVDLVVERILAEE